jgi:hypothetical protein
VWDSWDTWDRWAREGDAAPAQLAKVGQEVGRPRHERNRLCLNCPNCPNSRKRADSGVVSVGCGPVEALLGQWGVGHGSLSGRSPEGWSSWDSWDTGAVSSCQTVGRPTASSKFFRISARGGIA